MAPKGQDLRFAEALTMPRVQVIVLDANMRCQECRERVAQVLSKMDILTGYAVDSAERKVIVRGSVDPKKRTKRLLNEKKRKSIQIGGFGDTVDRCKKKTLLDQNLTKITNFFRGLW